MYRMLFSLIALILLLAGCAKPPVEKPRVFWPPLPEQPRLEWLANYYSEDDFPKTNSERLADELLGKVNLSFMQRPYGIASDPERDRVYVVDSLLRVVKIFDMRNRKLSTLGGDKPVMFNEPYGLAVDSAGRIYVADAGSGAVRVFSPDQKPLQAFFVRDGEAFRPIDLALNERLGRVYISDGRHSRIYVFDLQSGNLLFTFGDRGEQAGQLYAPQGLAIDAQDRVYVAELLNTRIQVFDADGRYLNQFGERGDLIYQFEGPKDLAFDSDGNLHIVDVRKAALITYRPDGTLLLFTGGKPTKSPLGFVMPVSIWIDDRDYIYIGDALNRRFSIWRYFSKEYIATHPEEFVLPKDK